MSKQSMGLLGLSALAVPLLATPAVAQTASCHIYDKTGRLIESEYSNGSEIVFDLDPNDNRNSVQKNPTGAAACVAPTANPGPVPGGDLNSAGGGASGGGGGGGGSNGAPTAMDDFGAGFQVLAGASQQTLFVLTNDTDPDSDPLTITAVTSASWGSVLISSNGTAVLYTPPASIPDSAELDTFSYTINDGQGGTDTANVTVTISSGFGGGL